MAKIDVTKIEGYATMTPEQKLAALEAFDYDDNSSELERYKSAVSKANSEAADWKKKHNALLSEDEQKKVAHDEAQASMKAQLDTLLQEKTVSETKAHLLALGYDDALASDTAAAMVKGENDKVFVNQKKFLEERTKALKAELLKNTPTPPAGNPPAADSFDKQLEAARASNDNVAIAALLRQQHEAQLKNE